MENLESVCKSIQSKRNPVLDSSNFPLLNLTLSEYDIRKNRARNPKLKIDLKRDGQLQPITVSKNGDVYTTVNGRTRQIEMIELNETDSLFETVKVEVYEDLTELEQNYLNAQINISQTPLTPDEKIEFVIKYKDILNLNDLMKALGLSKEMIGRHIPHCAVINTINKEDDHKDTYLIIDGKQRLSSIFDFIDDKFTIEIDDKEYLFSELPKDYQTAINCYNFRYYVVNEPWELRITDEQKIAWFKFINFAGTPQDKEHLNSL